MIPLIQPSELAGLLANNECFVLDCRFDLTDREAGRRAYLEGHVPGASYADLERDLSSEPRADQGRHPLPDPLQFAQTLGNWGVGNGSLVVVYDARSGAFAARAWWMLRWLGHEAVAVLDGGLWAWAAAGLPLEREEPRPLAASFPPPKIHGDWVVGSDALPKFAGPQGIVLDARSPARYRGEEEPIDPVAGHVPGAVNYRFENSLAADGRFLHPDELRKGLQRLIGTQPAERVVAMCGSGVTACHVLLAMRVAGLGDGRLYAGSWSEWIRDPRRPIATGPD